MKFRKAESQTSRDSSDDGYRHMLFAALRKKKSRTTLSNGVEQTNERPPSRTGPGFLRRKFSSTNLSNDAEPGKGDVPPVPALPSLHKRKNTADMSNSDTDVSEDDHPAVPPLEKNSLKPSIVEGADLSRDGAQTPQSPTKKKAWQALLQKKEVSLQDSGSRLEGATRGKKLKAVGEVQSGSFDAGEDILERVVKASKDEKRTPKAYDANHYKQRASRKLSLRVSPLPVEEEAEAAVSRDVLSVEQVRAMCIGAPAFCVEEQNGRYRPQVLFRGSNAETSAEFPTDYKAFGHPSFKASTLCTDALKEQAGDFMADDEDRETERFMANVTEVPSMLSADGLDPGAVGFEHFLQLPIADDAVRMDDSERSGKRKLLKSSPGELGLRQPNIEVLIFRLTELEQLHVRSKDRVIGQAEYWNETKVEEMGVDLFGKLLNPDLGTITPGTGGVSMMTQIRALQKVLRTSGLWYDFQLVQWRTRVGQLLWEMSSGQESNPSNEDEVDERDVVFLQITLAAELLIRINAVKATINAEEPIVSNREMSILNSVRTSKVDWDLLLAERFLDNISVSTKTTSELTKKANRSSLFYDMPLLDSKEATENMQYLQPQLIPRHGEQQLLGLVRFAETLQWPHVAHIPRTLDLSTNVNEGQGQSSPVPSTYVTPLSSPAPQTPPTSRSDSAGLLEPRLTLLSRTVTASSLQLVPAIHPNPYKARFESCGWLSRSWLSGLIMPGEAASHLLMSTLLEHSPKATAKLGERANLYGGFLFERRSYWSKKCVVGRVMAAKKGAAECMEWISIPEFGQAQVDGWLNIAVKEMPDSKFRPRILSPERIAKDSDLLHNRGLMDSARGDDFTWPLDGPLVAENEVIFRGLSFSNPMKLPKVNGAEMKIAAKPVAIVKFSSIIGKRLTVVEMPLTYDACFVSSYPCHPKMAKSAVMSPLKAGSGPLSPSLPSEQKDIRGLGAELPRPKTAPAPSDSGYGSKPTSASTFSSTAAEKDLLPATPVHPLHVEYHYDVVPVSLLFTAATETRPRTLSSGAERQQEMQAAAKEVMVLDCRGSADLELFARAWCAKVGEHAVIGKSGRTCLACCVREARALGICVVIRT